MTVTPKPPKPKRKKYDWEAIEVAFRAGVRSVLAISQEHGCSEGAIRKKAKERGWIRDKTEKVKTAVRAKLAVRVQRAAKAAKPAAESTNDAIRTFCAESTNGTKDAVPEISPEAEAKGIECEAELRAGIVWRHRELAEAVQAQVAAMIAELAAAGDSSLASRATILNNLSNVIVKMTAVEREAWGLTEGGDAQPIKIMLIQGDMDA